MTLVWAAAARQWVCVGWVGRYLCFEFSLYSILHSLNFYDSITFVIKKTLMKTQKKRELFLTPKPALSTPASPCCYWPSPAHQAMLRPLPTSQAAHSNRARPPLAEELWSCGARASSWAAQEGAPPASGWCIEPRVICYPHKACSCGFPYSLCWKERPGPQGAQREGINTAKELTDCQRQKTPIMNRCL